MVHFINTATLTLTLALGAQAAPLLHTKRIAQVISASTAKWEKACTAAGGAEKCNPISVTAFSTLLAAAGPCEQQDSADAMVNLAKTLNNDADMITFAQIFAQQPRNTPTSLAVPYCDKAPANSELNGLFQCQFAGANQQSFVGGLKAGDKGTIPFGLNAAPSPAGSCKANPSGPVPDGQQLSDLVTDSGAGSGSSGTDTGNAPATPSSTEVAPVNNAGSTATSSASTSEGTGLADDLECSDESTSASTTSAAAAAPAATSSAPSSSSSDFKTQNGVDAQALNKQFASLTADSSCNDGENACVENGFAQCVGGKFVVTKCSGDLVCAALPLVNKAGTSIACTTKADADARVEAAGVQGGSGL